MNITNKPTVIFFAEPDLLTLYLVDQLLQSGCLVMIVSDDLRLWKSGAIFITENPQCKFISTKEVANVKSEYCVVTTGMPKILWSHSTPIKVTQRILKTAEQYLRINNSKTIVYLPFFITSAEVETKVQLLQKTLQHYPVQKRIYVGDLYGRGMDYLDSRPISLALKQIATHSTIGIYKNLSSFVVLSVQDAVNQITRMLFSYWGTSEEIVLGVQLTPQQFINQLPKEFQQLPIIMSTINLLKVSTNPVIQAPRTFWFEGYIVTISWIKKVMHSAPARSSRPKYSQPIKFRSAMNSLKKAWFPARLPRPKTPQKFRRGKIIVFAAIGAFIILILPFINLLLAGVGIGLSVRSFSKGVAPSKFVINATSQLATSSKAGFANLATLPVIGAQFSKFASTAFVVERASSASQRASVVWDNAHLLLGSMLRDEAYDLTALAKSLQIELDALYQDVSFLASDAKAIPLIANRLPSGDQLAKIRELLLASRDIASRLPVLLSAQGRKTYLILLQNNSELRPTGGFIGSFALTTFENGKLADISVYDVYTADGQLKGHVEPPAPIKNYLGEANWYLRDSNWDPDFTVSAKQAEWFLEKEMDRNVEGVVGIDLEVVRGLLSVLGEVSLPGFSEKITSQNMYEKLQYEIESNFFPGSQKKATLLTELTNQLLNKLTTQYADHEQEVAKLLWGNLNQRHVQLFLHDPEAQRVIETLEWHGGINPPVCVGCTVAWLGTAEANVGVNKANYFIERSYAMQMQFDQGKINYNLDINYKNNSNGELKLGGRYKAYLRLLTTTGATIDQIQIIDNKQTKKLNPEIMGRKSHLEAGVLFEVGPGEAKTVRYTWSQPMAINFNQAGKLLVYWRKQAGTNADPLSLKLVTPDQNKQLYTEPPFILTEPSKLEYNTNLVTDFRGFIYW